MEKILSIIFILFFHSMYLFPQEVTNIRFEQEGKMINIHYDLKGTDTYEIKVYCSQDRGMTWGNPLSQVTGDVGVNQKSGINKMIIWDVLAESGALQGEIMFKVEALSPDSTGEAGIFIDTRDGKTYKWVKIGDQLWMAENLNYSKVPWSSCYDDKRANCETYGRLYYWKHAIDACPIGWHLPSDAEWLILITNLGGENVAGGKMKEAGTSHWIFPNSYATNESGFSALPGGAKRDGIYSLGLGSEGHFWSSYKSEEQGALEFWISNDDDDLRHEFRAKKEQYSVRCIKD